MGSGITTETQKPDIRRRIFICEHGKIGSFIGNHKILNYIAKNDIILSFRLMNSEDNLSEAQLDVIRDIGKQIKIIDIQPVDVKQFGEIIYERAKQYMEEGTAFYMVAVDNNVYACIKNRFSGCCGIGTCKNFSAARTATLYNPEKKKEKKERKEKQKRNERQPIVGKESNGGPAPFAGESPGGEEAKMENPDAPDGQPSDAQEIPFAEMAETDEYAAFEGMGDEFGGDTPPIMEEPPVDDDFPDDMPDPVELMEAELEKENAGERDNPEMDGEPVPTTFEDGDNEGFDNGEGEEVAERQIPEPEPENKNDGTEAPGDEDGGQEREESMQPEPDEPEGEMQQQEGEPEADGSGEEIKKKKKWPKLPNLFKRKDKKNKKTESEGGSREKVPDQAENKNEKDDGGEKIPESVYPANDVLTMDLVDDGQPDPHPQSEQRPKKPQTRKKQENAGGKTGGKDPQGKSISGGGAQGKKQGGGKQGGGKPGNTQKTPQNINSTLTKDALEELILGSPRAVHKTAERVFTPRDNAKAQMALSDFDSFKINILKFMKGVGEENLEDDDFFFLLLQVLAKSTDMQDFLASWSVSAPAVEVDFDEEVDYMILKGDALYVCQHMKFLYGADPLK